MQTSLWPTLAGAAAAEDSGASDLALIMMRAGVVALRSSVRVTTLAYQLKGRVVHFIGRGRTRFFIPQRGPESVSCPVVFVFVFAVILNQLASERFRR